MKKGFLIILFLVGYFSTNAQKDPDKKVSSKIDTVKTEVVEVVTKYNPKIADARKIRKNPTVKLLEKSKKKKLNYLITSAPVASTFIPKAGVIKGIDVGVREQIYSNFIAVGFGNYTTPYLEAYINSNTRFETEFGFYTKYNASLDNIENTLLNSNFSNFIADIFLKKEERYFDWKVSLNSERNEYNWYGLPTINFSQNTLNSINEKQTYNLFNLSGEIDFLDAFLDKSTLSVSYFSDAFNSNEFIATLDTDLSIPLGFMGRNSKNLLIKTGLEFLSGKFSNDYTNLNEINYSIFTTNINPEYNVVSDGFFLKLGTKFYASFDTENKANNFLIYPDILINKTIVKDYLNIYAGISGDLKTNTFNNFTKENPYISPTLFITQTSEKNNIFFGIKGAVNNKVNFNISASVKEEEDSPFFIRNNSKSDGTNNTLNNSPLKGYEFGNSFNVVYDDVKTTTFFAELQYTFSKELTFGTNIQLDNFSMTNQIEAWNLPTLQTSFTGKYKNNKWFATSNIFYVNERKDLSYNAIFPAISNGSQTLNSFLDVNINGGYHFNDKFSVFVKLNNILNNNYQRFANYNVQGFQALGGVSYKFDF